LKACAAGLLLGAALTAPVNAQEAPAEVTDGEIAKYKVSAQNACREVGMAGGDSQARISAFCQCALEVFSKNMTRAEWQQAYFYSLKNQVKEEQAVYAPHRARLEACRQP
jgi:hypothetical protein